MADNLRNSVNVATSGLSAQSARLRIIAQNIANADTTATTPGGDPYRRQTITFENVLDKKLGVEVVRVKKYGTEPGEFPQEYNPHHPAADAAGYVKKPNVNTMIETADSKEAQRSYEANLSVIETSRQMLNQTIDLLR